MRSSLRRGSLAATAAVLSIATLAACGAGNRAQTLQIKPDNAATTVGDIKIQNVNIVTAEGEDDAVVSARLFNEGRRDQILTSIGLPGSDARVELAPAEDRQQLVVPAGGTLALGGTGHASAVIPEAEAAGISNGSARPIVFDLSRTGQIELRATVVPATGPYASWGPSAPADSPEPEETAADEASPGATTEEAATEPAEDTGNSPDASAEAAPETEPETEPETDAAADPGA